MKEILVKWIYDKNIQYGKEMRVVESNHPRFVKGSRFDYGFFDIATDEGYTITSFSTGKVEEVRNDALNKILLN